MFSTSFINTAIALGKQELSKLRAQPARSGIETASNRSKRRFHVVIPALCR